LQPKRKTVLKDSDEKVSKTGKTGKQEQLREQLEDQSQTQQEQTFPSKQDEEDESPLITGDIVVRSPTNMCLESLLFTIVPLLKLGSFEKEEIFRNFLCVKSGWI